MVSVEGWEEDEEEAVAHAASPAVSHLAWSLASRALAVAAVVPEVLLDLLPAVSAVSPFETLLQMVTDTLCTAPRVDLESNDLERKIDFAQQHVPRHFYSWPLGNHPLS